MKINYLSDYISFQDEKYWGDDEDNDDGWWSTWFGGA
jgi:hypothetical protein